MSKESTKAALDRYYERQERERKKEQFGTRRKNEKPEIELTQKPCKSWFRRNGWAMFILDARAEWNADAQAFVRREDVEPGFSDAVGCTSDGTAAFVEFKAPGKRSTLKAHQREFLTDKILKGCFAVCVDSVDCLHDVWIEFKSRRNSDVHINYLLRQLPPVPVSRRPINPDSTESLF